MKIKKVSMNESGTAVEFVGCFEAKLPEMTFWQRLKFLFTGKTPKRSGPIAPPPVMPEQINKNFVTAYKPVPYTTFAGCDIKAIAVFDLSGDASREEIWEVWRPTRKDGESIEEYNSRLSLSRSTNCRVFGEIQAISCRTELDSPDDYKTKGDVIFTLFDRDVYNQLKDKGCFHIILEAANEYGDISSMIIPDVRFTTWSWGISIDDLISEVRMDYKAREPMYWEWIKNPNLVAK